MKKFLLSTLFLPLNALAAIHSSSNIIQEGNGHAADCEMARNIAIKNALEKFAGQSFEYKKHQSCKEVNNKINCSFEKSLDVDSAGTLKRIISQNVNQKELCYVTVKVELEDTRLYDLTLNGKLKYLSGEPLEFNIVTNEPLYLYVFNIFYAGLNYKKAELIFPSERIKNNFVSGKFIFPGTNEVKFTTYVAVGDVSKEKLVFLFTKYKLYDRKEWTVLEIDDMIKSIPTFSRRVVYQDIIIERRMR